MFFQDKFKGSCLNMHAKKIHHKGKLYAETGYQEIQIKQSFSKFSNEKIVVQLLYATNIFQKTTKIRKFNLTI